MSSDMGQPVVNIVGERVALGPLVREHIPLFARWRNDFAVARTFGGTPRARTHRGRSPRVTTRAMGMITGSPSTSGRPGGRSGGPTSSTWTGAGAPPASAS